MFLVRVITCEVLISDQDVVMLVFEEAPWGSLRSSFSVSLVIVFVQG